MIGISACRDADKRLESEVRAAIKANDIPALMTRAYQPVAVRMLSPYSHAFADLLAGGPFLPLRTMRGLGIHGESHKTYTKAQTVRRLRAATGRKAEIVRALLTGEGDPAALTLRRLAEAVRGVPLDVYDLSEAAAREPVLFEIRSDATKRAAVTRTERHKGSGKSAGTSVTPERHGVSAKSGGTRAERAAAAIAKRSARQLERDAERERRREARLKRRECSEADTLEPRLSYRDRLALEGGQQ